MTYIAPQIFREWTPIKINKINKPQIVNLGSLPLLIWYINDKPNVIIDSCKHLGNSLKTAKIENNCLICPFHKQSYNETDKLGTTIIKNGIVWWSYKSHSNTPPTLLKTTNKPYNIEIDINIDLITFILNLLTSNSNYKAKWNNKKKQLFLRTEEERIIYRYPYRIVINNNKWRYSEELAIMQLSPTKIRIFITVYNELLIPYVYMKYIKMRNKFEREITTSNLNIKNHMIFKNNENNYLMKVYKSYENFMYITDYTVNHFMINKNYY